MKNLMFKFWKWRLDFKVSKIPDNERLECITRMFWKEVEIHHDLTVSTGTFKQVSLEKFPFDKEVRMNICQNYVLRFKTDKY